MIDGGWEYGRDPAEGPALSGGDWLLVLAALVSLIVAGITGGSRPAALPDREESRGAWASPWSAQ